MDLLCIHYTHSLHTIHTLHILHISSFSHSGGVLCGVGRGGHGKTLVVLWNTSQVGHSGEVSVLAKAHTDTSIKRMRIAAFDDSRWDVQPQSLSGYITDHSLGEVHYAIFCHL